MSNATGLLSALLLDGKGGAQRLEWDRVAHWTAADGVLWLNLDYSIPDAAAWLHGPSGIESLVLEALLDHDPRPRAVVHNDGLMLIVRGINQNQGSEPEDMISVRAWIEPHRVITMRHRVSRSLESLAADLERGKGSTGAGDLTADLVDRIVDHAVRRVDTLSDSLAASEDEIMLDDLRNSDLRAQLADLRRRAIALRRFLSPQREALAKLAIINLPWFTDHLRDRVLEATDRMTRTVEELDAARDRAAVTQEQLAARLTELTNRRLYVLSIITAVFLPLGFVCALLGVNVGGIPFREDEWAFWALVAVFVVGVAIQLWFFRKRGWFG